MRVSGAEQGVRAAFAEQAAWCRELASPLTALLCQIMAEEPWPEGEVMHRLRAWPGDPRSSGDALPLRLCGGLHAAVRNRSALPLAACYPPNPLPERAILWAALRDALSAPELATWLDRPPQTNEVGRSNALFAGLLAFVDRFPFPVALFELG